MTETNSTMLKEQILDLSRQNNIAPLVPWFDDRLELLIKNRVFLPEHDLDLVAKYILNQLVGYRLQTGASTVVLGMSGGVDSALTASLFKQADWRVIGVTMPIHQAEEETDRGIEACDALGIEHIHKDLTSLYEYTREDFYDVDPELLGDVSASQRKATKIRQGNIRARLRMITLYNLASKYGGLVASTDNFSELTAGFWTLHGDVGDVSPIQSLWKSWEVPYLAKTNGVPEATWRAKPTDGLGIDAGDEAQLGASYLQWDIMLAEIIRKMQEDPSSSVEGLAITMGLHVSSPGFNSDGRDGVVNVFNSVTSRMGATWFKRMNPVNLSHVFDDRYAAIAQIDKNLFVPSVLQAKLSFN